MQFCYFTSAYSPLFLVSLFSPSSSSPSAVLLPRGARSVLSLRHGTDSLQLLYTFTTWQCKCQKRVVVKARACAYGKRLCLRMRFVRVAEFGVVGSRLGVWSWLSPSTCACGSSPASSKGDLPSSSLSNGAVNHHTCMFPLGGGGGTERKQFGPSVLTRKYCPSGGRSFFKSPVSPTSARTGGVGHNIARCSWPCTWPVVGIVDKIWPAKMQHLRCSWALPNDSKKVCWRFRPSCCAYRLIRCLDPQI